MKKRYKNKITIPLKTKEKRKIKYSIGFNSVASFDKNTVMKEEVLIDDDRVILKSNEWYTLIIDYPLSRKYMEIIKSGKKGKTIREITQLIVNRYKKIYKEEEKTSLIKEGPIGNLFLLRRRTNGKYGIYGHYIEDLCIHDIVIDDKKNIIYPLISS